MIATLNPHSARLRVLKLRAADLNGDGLADVLVTPTDYSTYNTYPIQILLNNRHGGFYDGTRRVADFNNDGRPDIFGARRRAVVAAAPREGFTDRGLSWLR